ncbi:recombinase family protein [Mycobacterium sp. ST-F2]|uniref:recombinase family protein n=1 Tax=Mycobacterium sp. ST-F2 TaxID=1490484 RepID=UPI00093DDFA6|nr:recombinase family protein [Mycobacterium sp. ST-F2]
MTSTYAPDTVVRAGCYLRISSDPNDKRQGVDRQREDTTALCEIKGWTPAGYYVDNDRSASNGKDRPQWDRLLADLKAGKVDAIAVWDQDRGWRMMADLERLRESLAALGRPVLLASTNQGEIDLSSPTGVMMAQVKTAVSEHEIAMMRVRMQRAAKQRAQQGRPKWRKAFGYLPYTGSKQDDTGVREIDPVVAPLVREAYRNVLAGRTLVSIAADWNDAGHHGHNGKPWSPSTVSLFLRSPRNAGLRAHNDQIVLDDNGQRVRGTWPPLVDETLWDATQTFFESPDRKRPGPKSVTKHLLTGVLVCGKPDCGGRFVGKWRMVQTGGEPGRPKAGQTKQSTGRREHRITYYCRQCQSVSIRAEHVEPLVLGVVAARLAQPDAVDLIRSTQLDAQAAAQLRQDRLTLAAKLDEIADMLADGEFTREQAARATARTNDKLKALARQDVDHHRQAVLDAIPLGTDGVAAALEELEPDQYRAVLNVVCGITVLPLGRGRGRNVAHRDRLVFDWRS